MWPTTPEFKKSVKRSHTANVRLAVSPTGQGREEFIYFEVIDGSVVFDRTRDTRSSLEVTIAGETVEDPESLFAPFGAEIHAWRGVNGEMIPLGVFRIVSFDQERTSSGNTVRLEGLDRSHVVSRAQWEETYVVETAVPIDVAITNLILSRYPQASISLPPMTSTTWRAIFDGSEGDPWKDALKLGSAAGFDLFFDRRGELTAEIPASNTDPPTFILEEGEEATVIEETSSASTLTSIYNGVVAIADNSELETPLRSFAFDNDPESPTYYFGPFGKVHRRWASQLVKTQQQLDRAAQSVLSSSIGLAQEVELVKTVDPSIETNDVIGIRGHRAEDILTLFIIDRVEVPLSPSGTQRMTGRKGFFNA